MRFALCLPHTDLEFGGLTKNVVLFLQLKPGEEDFLKQHSNAALANFEKVSEGEALLFYFLFGGCRLK